MGFFENATQFLKAFLIIFLLHKSRATTLVGRNDRHVKEYFFDYGYAGRNLYSTMNNDLFADLLKNFQRFSGLDVTGVVDEATISMMAKPRCGLEDYVEYGGYHRKKRYVAQGSRWHMNNLTYRIRNYPRTMNADLVNSEIARAFQLWSEVTRINFTKEERADEEPHISIRFEKGDHGGLKRFDGVDKDLGYAYFPECGGDIYFDDDETWTSDEFRGKNLFQMAAHMIGHSLGLEHSDLPQSVMSPFYHRFEPQKELSADDIVGIQSLYGLRIRNPRVIRPRYSIGSLDPDGPNLCNNPSIDAATIVDDGRAFIFKGIHYWEVHETGGIVYGPRKISDDWGGVPGPIDAALTWNDGKTYLFKGDYLYRFKNREREHGYPKQISEVFPGIPSDLDAAFVYSGNGRIYFFKGDKYWRFESCRNPSIMARYPLTISNWNNLPNNVDAVMTWRNQRTYFFTGETYYKYDDKTNSVATPNSTARNWFRCPNLSPTVDCDC